MGLWGGLDILTDPYTGRMSRTITVSTIQHVDVAVRHAASFGAIKFADIV